MNCLKGAGRRSTEQGKRKTSTRNRKTEGGNRMSEGDKGRVTQGEWSGDVDRNGKLMTEEMKRKKGKEEKEG